MSARKKPDPPFEITRERPREPQPVRPRWYKIFVCHIPNYISSQQLQEIYQRFGTVVEAYVPRSDHTGRSRRYGYVKFGSYEEAKAAIDSSPPPMRAHWSVFNSKNSLDDLRNDLRFNDVSNSTHSGNCTICVDNLSPYLSKEENEKLLKHAFCKYGTVRKVIIRASNMSAYVVMATSEAATLSILDRDGKPIYSVGVKEPHLLENITVKWAKPHPYPSSRSIPYRRPNLGYGLLGPIPFSVQDYTDAGFSAPGPARLRPRVGQYGYHTSQQPWFHQSASPYNLESAIANPGLPFNIGAVPGAPNWADNVSFGIGNINPYVRPGIYATPPPPPVFPVPPPPPVFPVPPPPPVFPAVPLPPLVYPAVPPPAHPGYEHLP